MANVVNQLNAVIQGAGSAGEVPVITSSLAVNLTAGDTLNYELLADYGVGYEWTSLPSGVTTVDGNVRKLIGGSGLAAGTYNIGVKAINYYGEDSETLVLTVSNPPFSNTKSIEFASSEYLQADYSASGFSALPFYRASNGAGAGDAWSMSMWFKAAAGTGNGQTMFYYGNSDTANQGYVWLTYQASNNELRFRYGSNVNYVQLRTPNSSITDGTWHHIMITYDGGTTGSSSGDISNYYSRFEIFIDGVSQTTTNTHSNFGWSSGVGTSSGGTNYLRIGNRIGSNYIQNNSRIDEIAFWDSDQTSNVTAIYNSGSASDLSALGTPPNNWIRMGDGDTYPTIGDAEGDLSFTMTNMVAGNIVTDSP